MLGVNHKTIQRDVAQSAPQGGTKSATGSAATKAKRDHAAVSVFCIRPTRANAATSITSSS